MPKKRVERRKSKKKHARTVTANMLIGDVVSKYPQATEAMIRYGLHCIGCHVAFWETIAQGAAAHGMDRKQIRQMIAEINSEISRRKR